MSALQQYMETAGAVGQELSSEAMGQFESKKEQFNLENAYDDLQTQQTGLKAQEGESIGMASEGGAKAIYYGRKLYKSFANNDVAKKYASKMADSLLGEENSKALQSAIKGGSQALEAYKGGDVSKLIEGLKGGDSDAIGAIKGLLPKTDAGTALAEGLDKADTGAIKGVSSLLESLQTKGGKIVSGAKQAVTNATTSGENVVGELGQQAKNALGNAGVDLGGGGSVERSATKVSFADEPETFSYNPRSRIVPKSEQQPTKPSVDEDTSWLDKPSKPTAPEVDPLADVEPLDITGKIPAKTQFSPEELAQQAETQAKMTAGEAVETDMFGKPIQPKQAPTEEFEGDLPEEAGWRGGVFVGEKKGAIPQTEEASGVPKADLPDVSAPESIGQRSMAEIGADPEANPFSYESFTGIGGGQTRANLDSLFPQRAEASDVSFQFQRPTQPKADDDEWEDRPDDVPNFPPPEIKPQDIQQGRFVGDQTQDARDALAQAMGKDRNAGNVAETDGDTTEIKLANPFEEPSEVSKYAGVDKYGYERAETDLPSDYQPPKPSQLSGEEIPNPAFDPDQDLRPEPKASLQPETQLDEPTASSLKAPTADFDAPKALGSGTDELTDVLDKGVKPILSTVAEKGGSMIADEGIGIGTRLLGMGGTFLEALGPLGDLAMLGSMAYSAFTEKDEGAEMLNQGDKIHAQLMSMGQGASISEGSLAGSALNTMPQSVGATFPHF